MDPNKQYEFRIDKDSLEQLKMLPGGNGIYDYVKQKAEELAAAIDISVGEIIDRHELPLDPERVAELGYVIAVEAHASSDGKEHRAAVLYKKIDEVEVRL